MDPLTIVAGSFALVGGIAKTSILLVNFSREVHDATNDLDAISAELQALAAVLDPLTRVLSKGATGGVSDALVAQVGVTITGCNAVVDQIEENIQKYRRTPSSEPWGLRDRDATDLLSSRCAEHEELKFHARLESFEFYGEGPDSAMSHVKFPAGSVVDRLVSASNCRLAWYGFSEGKALPRDDRLAFGRLAIVWVLADGARTSVSWVDEVLTSSEPIYSDRATDSLRLSLRRQSKSDEPGTLYMLFDNR
ncbi:hypothetical protein OQA88_8174 [Cercophora sp. LCS_1]